VGSHITENILRLDISVANTLSVDVCDGAHELVGVEFNNEVWYFLLHFEVLLHYTVSCVGDVVHHYIQVHLVWFISISIKTLAHFHAVRVVQHLQNGQLPVLIPFILENFFNRHSLPCLRNHCFENNPKRTVAYDFLCIVSQTLLELIFILLVVFSYSDLAWTQLPSGFPISLSQIEMIEGVSTYHSE
jgi:hypothetical protein